jgi:flagella basal body P-ring formation protein FlgA
MDVDLAIDKFSKMHPDVNISVVSYGHSKKACHTELRVKSKLPIKPSSRWILKIICPNKWKANISTKTEVLHRHYITKRDIYKGEKINLSSVRLNEMWSDKITTNYIDVLGKLAKVKIPKGFVVKSYALDVNYLVKKKQKLSVILKSKSMSLKITAITLEPGNIYDIIEVMNANSKKKLFVRIISKNEAILE